jgi:hypothetical protein
MFGILQNQNIELLGKGMTAILFPLFNVSNGGPISLNYSMYPLIHK